ncbi:glucose-6-phosphate isomerase [Campylobacter sp. VBCF_05 NA6]|uniref:glucose-6-phosphate isomerase n=1 Tax=unclassified Campylobacter TaxID=2593542 RepID=UPI0022E99D16|nr:MULTISPECIES: glucose-6-phosphate isomerase [unclassified Campylobacter]MDA3057742.1 glucose-6-phosphate isomerase [Campylobacter sp. VBCF_04 NA7]MDA3058884.1 glucose-6-phosphate isomerase [Campylobacter sp. VBCF_05 NA6]
MIKNKLFFTKAKNDALKNVALALKDEFESGEIGYYHLPDSGERAIAQASEFLAGKIFSAVVVVGIGGSSVGVRAFYEMLREKIEPNLRFEILDNLDDFSVKNALNGLKFNDTLFIISSKSGTTIETISLFKVVLDEFGAQDLSRNFIFITDPNSALETYAKSQNATVINMPANVGGRFSVLSAVGLVPALALGLDARALLAGAKMAQERFLGEILNGNFENLENNEVVQKARHYATHKNATINVIFSYCDRLKAFNDWYVQLWAESIGKKIGYTRYGLTPVGLVGSRDQHSFLQLIMDGVKDKTVTFMKLKNSGTSRKIPNLSLENLASCDFVNDLSLESVLNFQCDATAQAVINEGVSVDVIEVGALDEANAGFLFYYFELLTSGVGAILGVNTYDQPGVEAGKRILKSMILNR